jgi:hypothetical protein
MKRFKKNLAMLIIVTTSVVTSTFAQNDKKGKDLVELNSSNCSFQKGSNPHIKQERVNSDERSKGWDCSGKGYMQFENYTDYTIDVYVDGYYSLTLGPWGSYLGWTCTGFTDVYGISAGGTKDWSKSKNVYNGYTTTVNFRY